MFLALWVLVIYRMGHLQCALLGLDVFGSFCACTLQAGHLYDLQVVHRLCAMWFNLSSDTKANEELDCVFSVLPSFKLVPLVSQVCLFSAAIAQAGAPGSQSMLEAVA